MERVKAINGKSHIFGGLPSTRIHIYTQKPYWISLQFKMDARYLSLEFIIGIDNEKILG